MNTTSPPIVSAAKRSASSTVERSPRRLYPMELDKTSPEGRRRAAVVLEVLAGLRTCLQAAEALGFSLGTYYKLEQRALEGLVSGCQSILKGKRRYHEDQVGALQRQCQNLQRDLLRYQALVRVTQRSAGLAAVPIPKPGSPKDVKGKRLKRPTVRALKAVEQLRAGVAPEDTTPPVAVRLG